jgi:predicted ThiF/HesA family dinucleotide-utilizing enzyme
MAVLEKVRHVGRKKRHTPSRTVRLDADLIAMADLMARRQGLHVSDYLSAFLRPFIEKEWAKEVERIPKPKSKGSE